MGRHHSKYIMPMIILISKTAWWCQCSSDCHWGSGTVTDLTKITQPVCGRTGLQTCVLVTPDPTSLGTYWIIPVPPWPVWGCGTENERTSCFKRIVFELGICFPNLHIQVEGGRGPAISYYVTPEWGMKAHWTPLSLLYSYDICKGTASIETGW